MGKRWSIHPHDSDRIAHLQRDLGVPALVAQLLICRGITDPNVARPFLDANLKELRDPDELPGVPAAADRIYSAICGKRRIAVYGDYDADGMTATAILYLCLQLLGADVGYFVPNRVDDGYGLNDDALKDLASRGASMIVTVDCGIASISEADTANELGLELIITDHHEMSDRLPKAAAIVHPRLPGHSYPFTGLCGAGVAFKLAWALCQRASQSKKVGEAMREFLLTALGLSAIGTVADVVPLLDENRILVRHGLISLLDRPLTGLRALMRICGLDKKPSLTSEDIGFSLGPRLNAVGRLDQARLGVELLTTNDSDRADSLVQYIQELNQRRDSHQRSIYLAANKQIQEQYDPEGDPAFVLADRGWHPGVIGIVAGKLADKYHRPTVLIAQDELGTKPGMGSARSACGLNLHQALAACTETLVSHGGHAAAAGLKVNDADLDAFRTEFCEYAAGEISEADRVAQIEVDVEAPLSQLTIQTVKQIEQLAPFGQDNPRPILCTTGVKLKEPPHRMGGGDRHVSLKISQHGVTLRAVAFGKGEWAEDLAEVDGPFDIVYRPVINEFRGRRNVELHLVDWRVVKTPASVSQ